MLKQLANVTYYGHEGVEGRRVAIEVVNGQHTVWLEVQQRHPEQWVELYDSRRPAVDRFGAYNRAKELLGVSA